jgi:hypothetical protein
MLEESVAKIKMIYQKKICFRQTRKAAANA